MIPHYVWVIWSLIQHHEWRRLLAALLHLHWSRARALSTVRAIHFRNCYLLYGSLTGKVPNHLFLGCWPR
jgi:hypothetical protein